MSDISGSIVIKIPLGGDGGNAPSIGVQVGDGNGNSATVAVDANSSISGTVILGGRKN